jgi:hypothetical protein
LRFFKENGLKYDFFILLKDILKEHNLNINQKDLILGYCNLDNKNDLRT